MARITPASVTLAAALAGIAACSHAPTSQDVVARWYGHPVREVVKEWGSPRSIVQLEEKRLEYGYPRPDIDPSCVHYWIVNRQGYIIGHRHEGDC